MGRKTLHEFTEAEDTLLRTLSEAGYYDRLIAEEMGLPQNIVRNRRIQRGIRKMYRRNTATMDALVEMEAAFDALMQAAAAFLKAARNGN